MTFGKVIFNRELTFAKGKFKNYIKQKLAIFHFPTLILCGNRI